MPDNKIATLFRSLWVAHQQYGERFGMFGKQVSGSWIIETGDGRVWVTLDDGTAIRAVNNAVARIPGLKIIVKPNRDGEMEIEGVQSAITQQSTGQSVAPAIQTPPHQHFIGSGNEDPVESRRFMPGLLHAFSGLTVYIESFSYEYNGTEMRWPGGTIDLTSNLPVTAGYWAWVKVGINPATNTAVATTGTEYALRASLTLSVLDAINFDTSGYIPCGGVILREGQTAGPRESDFGEARDFITKFDPARPPAIGGTTPAAGTFTTLTNTGSRISKLRVHTAAGAVTVASDDHIVVVNKTSGAATTVNLPSSPATGRTLIIKDGKGDCQTNNITLTPASGNIDGEGTFVMRVNYTAITLVYNGTEWSII